MSIRHLLHDFLEGRSFPDKTHVPYIDRHWPKPGNRKGDRNIATVNVWENKEASHPHPHRTVPGVGPHDSSVFLAVKGRHLIFVAV